VDEVVEHHPDACRRCGTLLEGEDSAPLRHQVIEIPPITPLVIEHRLQRLVSSSYSTSTCAPLPAAVEVRHFGPRLSSLVGLLLGSAFPLSFSKTQALLQYLLGVGMSRGEIATIRLRLSAALAEPMAQALEAARQQPVAYVVVAVFREAVGNNPTGKRGWQWVMVTAVVTVFIQGMSRSTTAAIELIGSAFGGIVVSNRSSAYNQLPTRQRQLCWANLCATSTLSPNARAPALNSAPSCWACSNSCLGSGTATRTKRSTGPPSNNAAGHSARNLRPRCNGWLSWVTSGARPAPVGDSAQEQPWRPSRQGAICRSRLLTVTTSLRQQGRDVWQFLEQAWIAHHRGGVIPSLLPDP